MHSFLQSGFPPPYGSARPKRAYSSVFLKAQRFERSMDKIQIEQEEDKTTSESSNSRYYTDFTFIPNILNLLKRKGT